MSVQDRQAGVGRYVHRYEAERTDALIDLTLALKRLTWVLLLVAFATLGVAIWALVHG